MKKAYFFCFAGLLAISLSIPTATLAKRLKKLRTPTIVTTRLFTKNLKDCNVKGVLMSQDKRKTNTFPEGTYKFIWRRYARYNPKRKDHTLFNPYINVYFYLSKQFLFHPVRIDSRQCCFGSNCFLLGGKNPDYLSIAIAPHDPDGGEIRFSHRQSLHYYYYINATCDKDDKGKNVIIVSCYTLT